MEGFNIAAEARTLDKERLAREKILDWSAGRAYRPHAEADTEAIRHIFKPPGQKGKTQVARLLYACIRFQVVE